MNNLTIDEKKAIKYWTSPNSKLYREIKKACDNKYIGTTHEISKIAVNGFNNIEKLFNRCRDNTTSYETIYRADVIENKENEKLLDDELFIQFCQNYSKHKIFMFDDMICSFSSCKGQANSIVTKNDKYKSSKTPRVLYILEKRISKYLYIADHSQIPEEKEVIAFLHNSFKILKQEKFDDNYVELTIEEIEI